MNGPSIGRSASIHLDPDNLHPVKGISCEQFRETEDVAFVENSEDGGPRGNRWPRRRRAGYACVGTYLYALRCLWRPLRSRSLRLGWRRLLARVGLLQPA